MNAVTLIFALCVVQISTFVRSVDSQYILSFGHFFGNRGRPFGQVGGFSNVAPDVRFGRNSHVGSYCRIASGCSMGDNVRVGNYVQMDEGTAIGNECQILDYVQLGPYVTMGPQNLVLPYTQIQSNAQMGPGCIMDQYSQIGPNTKLEPNAYAGQYCQIGSNAMIGENAVLQPYASVPNNGRVDKNDVVIRTPTTSELYSNCLPMHQIPPNDVEMADKGPVETLNGHLRLLMSMQKQQLSSGCQQNGQNMDFKPLKLVISLYLIRFDGLDGFVQNSQQNNFGGNAIFSFGGFGLDEVYINGRKVTGTDSRGKEKHFIEGSPKKFLESDMESDMVDLMAIKQDSQRENRVPGDTFCKMASDIQSKQRKVKCDDSVDVGRPPNNGNGQPPQAPNNNRGNGYPPNVPPVQTTTPRNIDNYPNPPVDTNNRDYPNSPRNPDNYPSTANMSPAPTNTPSYRAPQPNNSPNTPQNNNNKQPKPPVNNNNGGNRNTTRTPNNYNTTPNLIRDNPTTTNAPDYTTNTDASTTDNNDIYTTMPTTNDNNYYYSTTNRMPRGPAEENKNLPKDLKIGKDSQIGSNCQIAPGCSIGDNVRVGNNVQMDQGTSIGNDCQIMDYAKLGPHVTMGPHNLVHPHAQIQANVEMGAGCIMDQYSNIGPNTKLEPNAYAGQYCQIGSNAMIGENSVLQPFASIPNNGRVNNNDVVIRTPTTSELYSNCLSMNQIPPNDMALAVQGPIETLNGRLRQLMSMQKQKVSTSCQQSGLDLDFKPFGLVITLYLIRFDGLDRFTKIIIDEANENGLNKDEKHFVQGSPKKFLEPDMEIEMIDLMALKQDSQRVRRVPGDTFCKMAQEVQSKQRQVKCDDSVEIGRPSNQRNVNDEPSQTPYGNRGNGYRANNSPARPNTQ